MFINVANAAPAAAADGPYTVDGGHDADRPRAGVLGNDSDGDGDPLTAVLVADATNGTVTLQADGSFDYVPDPDFAGSDSFTYRASDGLDTSAVTTVTITVTAVDDPPVAAPDFLATAEDTTLVVPAPGVLGNDAEVDGDPITAVVLTPPSNGQLTLDPIGSLTYVPDADFHGADSFTYAVDDGTSSDTATVTLSVSPVNDAPVATSDSKATAHETSVLIDVLANDADVDGDSLTISAVGTPSVGTATIESGRVRYTPPAGFAGAATFSYTASDGTATDSATVTVTVAPEPTPFRRRRRRRPRLRHRSPRRPCRPAPPPSPAPQPLARAGPLPVTDSHAGARCALLSPPQATESPPRASPERRR